MKNLSSYKGKSLSAFLLFYIVLCSAFFTLFVTAFQLYTDYKRDINSIHTSMQYIQDNYLKPLEIDTYNLNYQRINLQLEAILNLRDIEYVEIFEINRNGKKVIAHQGNPETEKEIHKEFIIEYPSAPKGTVNFAKLHVDANKKKIYQRLWDKALIILFSNALKTFFASFFIFIIIRILITRHIIQLASHTRSLTLDKMCTPLALKRKRSRSPKMDELDQLVDSINQMQERMVIDISERERAKESERKSEKRFRDLFNTINDFVYTHDFKGRFISVNPSFCKASGYKDKELIGRKASEFMSPKSAAAFESEYLEKLKKTRHYKGSITFLTKNGENMYIECRSSTVNSDDKETYINGIGRDVTERIITKRKVSKLQRKLAQSQKMEAIGTLAGGIAHDFNNILSIIFGFIDLAKMNPQNPDEQRKNLDEAYKGALRAKELVNQILTFSRKTEQKKQPLQISLIIKDALKLLRSSIPSSIEIKQEIFSQRIVMADSTQINQIIMNLCTNAYHAMSRTGGTLTISLKDMEISEDVIISDQGIISGEYVQLEVRDTGQGMGSEIKEKIFDPYFTTKEIGEGTGLGLAVVHGIVKSHNGFINVYSEAGVGTSFHVYLPVFKEKFTLLEPISPKEPVKGGRERIMFVDDEKMISHFTHEVLTKHGYQVTLFENGAQALREFEKHMNQYDLVITDMSMPHMNGAELIEKILKLSPKFPVILCSGFSNFVNTEKDDIMGFRYLQKPVAMSDLLQTVRKVLDEEVTVC